MHSEFGADDVEVLIVDVRNMKERTIELAEEFQLSVPVLLDDKEIAHEVYDIIYTPTTFILDRHGRAVFRHVGFVPGQEHMLKQEVHLLLERA
jgi:hypothetical protein